MEKIAQIKSKLEAIERMSSPLGIARPTIHRQAIEALSLIAEMEKEEPHLTPICPFCGERHPLYIPGPGCRDKKEKSHE